MTDIDESATPADIPGRPAAEPCAAPPRGWSAEIVTLCALIAVVVVGNGLLDRTVILLTLGPIAGFMAGLGCRRWWTAVLVAVLGVVLGAAAASTVSALSWGPVAAWLPGVLQVAAVAAALGAVVVLATQARERLRPWIAAAAVAAIIATMWTSAIALANIPTSSGLTSIQRLESSPSFGPQMSDEDLYLDWIARLRAGESYYPMAVRSFAEESAAVGSSSLVRIRSPFSYRPPTLYVLLAALPPDGTSFVIAIMVVATVGVAAAYLLAREFVSRPVALAGTAFVAALFSAYGSTQLLDAETWAGALVLAAVAAFVLSRSHPRSARWLQIVAVVLALAATAFRELAAPLLVLGLVATLVDAETRSTRAWMLWAGGLAIAAIGLAAHWIAASQAFASATAPAVSASWFDPNGAGLVGAMFLSAVSTSLAFPIVALVLVFGMIGSAIAPRDWPSRLMLAGVAAGGPLVLFFVHPPGWTGVGTAPGYWGDLVMPTVFACAPLVFVWVSAVRRHGSRAAG